jgi:hypothetical protein
MNENFPKPNNNLEGQEKYTPLELVRFAEFMASKYEYTPDTKGGQIQYKEDQKEKFLKIAKVLSLYVSESEGQSFGGLIPALENKIKRAEKAYDNVPKNQLTEQVAEESIDDVYEALEFAKNNMKNASLGNDFEEWAKTHN